MSAKNRAGATDFAGRSSGCAGEAELAERVAAPNAMAVTARPNILKHNAIKNISILEYLRT
jgi:hypothetical protein